MIAVAITLSSLIFVYLASLMFNEKVLLIIGVVLISLSILLKFKHN